MKVKLLTTISFFTYQLSISQTAKLLQGKVLFQNTALKDVEVINKTAKISTRTNELGAFSLLVHEKDSLLFFSKDYFFKRLSVTTADIEQNNLVVSLLLKPLELDEVVIPKLKAVRLSKEDIREIKLNSSRPKKGLTIQGFKEYDIPNGIDFIRLGKQIGYLLSKEETTKIKNPVPDFKKFITTTIPHDFFSKQLQLKPEEKELFIEFCDADPSSKSLLQHSNILQTMDFLYTKNQEFKNQKTE